MNETIKVLTTRRSVRKFKSDPVPEKVLDEILTAGMYAPTGMGQQSPIIIVITDPEVRAEVSELNAEIAGMSGDPFLRRAGDLARRRQKAPDRRV